MIDVSLIKRDFTKISLKIRLHLDMRRTIATLLTVIIILHQAIKLHFDVIWEN